MKSLYIFTHVFPFEGGEPYLLDEYGVYADGTVNVTYIPKKGGTQMVDERLKVSVHGNPVIRPVHRIKALAHYAREFSVQHIGLYLKRFRYNVALLTYNIARAEQLILSEKLNEHSILYTYWLDDLGLTAAFIKEKIPGLKWISRAHGFDVYEEQSDDHHLFFKRLKLQSLDALYVVSKNGADYLQSQFPEYAAKIGFHYLGCSKVGRNPAGVPEDELHIATCAVIRDIKRLDRLFNILPALKYKKVIWHVIGDGPELERFKTLYRENNSGILSCKFYGRVSKKVLKEIYSTVPLDLFVSLSRTEGLPVSIMEALSGGIPVLATDAGGTREIVNGATGKLLDLNFTDEQVISILNEWKASDYITEKYRLGCEDAWEKYFNSDKNYADFKSEILSR